MTNLRRDALALLALAALLLAAGFAAGVAWGRSGGGPMIQQVIREDRP